MDLQQTEVLRCNRCGGYLRVENMYPHAIYGTRFTDGYLSGGLSTMQERYLKCPVCERMVLRATMNQLGTYHPGDLDYRDVSRLPLPCTPECQDWLDVLRDNELDRGLELFARLQALWLGNAARRSASNPKIPPPLEAENMRALIGLLNSTLAADRLFIAELHRELGEYETAMALLEYAFPRELQVPAAFVSLLASRRWPNPTRAGDIYAGRKIALPGSRPDADSPLRQQLKLLFYFIRGSWPEPPEFGTEDELRLAQSPQAFLRRQGPGLSRELSVPPGHDQVIDALRPLAVARGGWVSEFELAELLPQEGACNMYLADLFEALESAGIEVVPNHAIVWGS